MFSTVYRSRILQCRTVNRQRVHVGTFNIATTTTHQRVRLTVYDTQKCVNAAIFSDKSTVGNMFKRVSN